MKRLLLAGVTTCSALLLATSAFAAPAPTCTPSRMLPDTALSIPINLPGFGWDALTAKATDVHLYQVTGGTKNEVPVTVGSAPENGLLRVLPASPMVVGSAYELQFASFCSYGPVPEQPPLDFTAAASAPLPTKIGDPTGTPSVKLQDFGTTQFTITASYALADEMKPWASVYELTAVVDGQLVETRPVLSATSIDLEAQGWCDAAAAAKPTHTVALRARLPFAPTLDTTSTDMTFECPAPKIGTPGSPNPTNPGSSSGGTGNGSAPGSSSSSGTSSCSIAHETSSASSLSFAGLAGLGLALALLVRRRRAAA